jgi:hypothetical protein
MKRYYVSPVIGTGTLQDPYRPSLKDALTEEGSSGVWVIASNPDGTPKYPFALCLANAVNHVPLQNVGNVDSLPDITLDSTLAVLTNQQRNALLNFLSKRSISTTGLNTQSTFREVLERMGVYLDPNFNALNFDA